MLAVLLDSFICLLLQAGVQPTLGPSTETFPVLLHLPHIPPFGVLGPVLISHPAEGRRPGWPRWLIIYQHDILTNGHLSQ